MSVPPLKPCTVRFEEVQKDVAWSSALCWRDYSFLNTKSTVRKEVRGKKVVKIKMVTFPGNCCGSHRCTVVFLASWCRTGHPAKKKEGLETSTHCRQTERQISAVTQAVLCKNSCMLKWDRCRSRSGSMSTGLDIRGLRFYLSFFHFIDVIAERVNVHKPICFIFPLKINQIR